MYDFIKSSITLLIILIPIVAILLHLLFKNSVFKSIGLIWVISTVLASLNSEAKVLFEEYTRAFAIPVNIIIIGTGLYLASLKVKIPLKEMVDDLVKLSKGNIDLEINSQFKNQKNEIGLLANSINSLVLNLNKMISAIKLNSQEQSKIGYELNSIASSLTNTTSTQAASIEEVSATMEEIAANVSLNSDNSIKTEKITKKTIVAIDAGNKSTIKSVESMKEVAEKIKVINDIAFQTNILALNAAVEASHAGDAGKGFSVVATEVKKLAEKSKLAANAIEEVSDQVLNVTKKAGSQFEDIVEEANITAGLIKEIAANSLEQNTNIQQVNDSVQSLNQMVQTNTTEVDRINSGASSLLQTAGEMEELISFFKLRK